MKKRYLLLILFLGVVTVLMAQTDSTATENVDSTAMETTASHHEFSAPIENATKMDGDSAYMKNDYMAAIQIYETLLKKGESADLYYNLGNSYYKKDEIAKAILNYERALLLKQGNQDIQANLEIARSKTIDKVGGTPEIFFITWGKALINCMNITAWANLGIASFIILLISLFFFFFSKRMLLKKIGFFLGLLSLCTTVLSNVFAQTQKTMLTNREGAIIMAPSVTVRSTPSESGTSLFVIHEGHKVFVNDNSMKDWKEIRLEDGKIGWIKTEELEVI